MFCFLILTQTANGLASHEVFLPIVKLLCSMFSFSLPDCNLLSVKSMAKILGIILKIHSSASLTFEVFIFSVHFPTLPLCIFTFYIESCILFFHLMLFYIHFNVASWQS